MANYRALAPDKIIATLERLEQRISARFPESGLAKLCREITDTARTASDKAAAIAAPSMVFRLMSAGLILLGLLVALMLALNLDYRRSADNVYSVLQGIDSGFNLIVLLGAGALFVLRSEQINKRSRALKDLHELRSLMHIIDMHQLTKDPSVVTVPGPATEASAKRLLTPFELARYLDYCSEMLSLTAKIAALYAQSARDSVVIATVNDLEQLAANLSEKIWQKIGLLQREPAAANPTTPVKPAP
jgi:hypothetical protein